MKLTDEDELEVVVRYKLGASTPQLAERFGVSKSGVNAILVRHGVDPRPPPQPKPELTVEVVRLRKSGLSWKAVAGLAGCSVATARKRWDQHVASLL